MKRLQNEDLAVEWVPLSRLKPDPQNPRTASTQTILKLKQSLDRFGWTRPILAQKGTNIIVFGHQISKAARLRGDKVVPVIFKEFTDEERKAYNIADNKLAELSEWDEQKLVQMLNEITADFDLLDLGFNKAELDDLCEDLAKDVKSYEEEVDTAVDLLRLPGPPSPIWWIGGKTRLARWIISHFPEHICYVEPFGGGASILLRKPRVRSEVYNDFNHFVAEFFKNLRDNPREILSILAFMPHSRELYNFLREEFRKGPVHPDEPVLQSAMWYYVQHSSFSGQWAGDWAHGKTRHQPFKNSMQRLLQTAMRLKGVQIECKDFRYVFETYDGEDTLFYVDPPYLTHEKYYDKGQAPAFTQKDHADLAEILNNIKGKAAVSYYPHPFVDKAYKGWRRAAKKVRAWSFGITRTSKKKQRPYRTELLLMNY